MIFLKRVKNSRKELPVVFAKHKKNCDEPQDISLVKKLWKGRFSAHKIVLNVLMKQLNNPKYD